MKIIFILFLFLAVDCVSASNNDDDFFDIVANVLDNIDFNLGDWLNDYTPSYHRHYDPIGWYYPQPIVWISNNKPLPPTVVWIGWYIAEVIKIGIALSALFVVIDLIQRRFPFLSKRIPIIWKLSLIAVVLPITAISLYHLIMIESWHFIVFSIGTMIIWGIYKVRNLRLVDTRKRD